MVWIGGIFLCEEIKKEEESHHLLKSLASCTETVAFFVMPVAADQLHSGFFGGSHSAE